MIVTLFRWLRCLYFHDHEAPGALIWREETADFKCRKCGVIW